jgi:hypothetical protein
VFHLLIDTCIWLDLGKDYTQRPLLEALEELLKSKRISLILPRTVIEEFDRNKLRVIKESSKSLSSVIKRVKEAVAKFGDEKQKKMVLQHLSDVDHKLPSLGENAIEAFGRVEAMFAQASVIERTDTIKLRAAQRAIDRRAPFHHEGKNSIHDAILFETYTEFLSEHTKSGNRFAFITHNFKDFSLEAGDHRLPHNDFAEAFSKLKSLYFISLADALRRIEPAFLSELMFVQEWSEEPRRLTEIVEAIDELVTKVWYNRHQVRKEKIGDGTTNIVEKETFPIKDHATRPIQRDIWEGALRAAAEVEKRFGLENLGPWDDFEWGMLNGKLSALRWVLGEEWDMLDT